MQCLDCWQSIGDSIKHASIPADQKANIKDFDTQARDDYWNKKAQERKKAAQIDMDSVKERLDARRALYVQHLQSDAWSELRLKVIQRENNLCQGCRSAPIQNVHHMTYDRLGAELLTDLVGVCRSCHERYHPDKV